MPEPYRVMILLAWCPMRFGELTELRRMDIDTREEVIRIRRAVVRAGGGFQVTTPAYAMSRSRPLAPISRTT
jgi:integrase